MEKNHESVENADLYSQLLMKTYIFSVPNMRFNQIEDLKIKGMMGLKGQHPTSQK